MVDTTELAFNFGTKLKYMYATVNSDTIADCHVPKKIFQFFSRVPPVST